MVPNYYEILGIPPGATSDEIKQAYRQRAMKWHPDRGGSHAKMLEINEAFEILSDPSRRQVYDYARAHPEDHAAQTTSAAGSTQGREQAQNYPREWPAFEGWMNEIARDIKTAKFGQTEPQAFGLKFPTAEGSPTASILIVVGGIVGLVFWSSFIVDSGLSRYLEPILLLASIWGGAWGAVGLLRIIGTMLTEPAPPTTQPVSPSNQIVQCPRCTQKLRLPSVSERVRITCSSCQHAFFHNSTGT